MTKDQILGQLANVAGDTQIIVKMYSRDRQDIYEVAPLISSAFATLEEEIFLFTAPSGAVRAYVYIDKVVTAP